METDLFNLLPTAQRLALSYAPAKSHAPTLALLALDARLGGLVRQAREPLLAQIRLAWWRDRLGESPENWPGGEPLLAGLRESWAKPRALVGLVDGWEAQLGEDSLTAVNLLASARAEAWVALHRELGCREDINATQLAAYRWGMADARSCLSDLADRTTAVWDVEEAVRGLKIRLPRALRPLAVLEALARRSLLRDDGRLLSGPADFGLAIRVGLLGR